MVFWLFWGISLGFSLCLLWFKLVFLSPISIYKINGYSKKNFHLPSPAMISLLVFSRSRSRTKVNSKLCVSKICEQFSLILLTWTQWPEKIVSEHLVTLKSRPSSLWEKIHQLEHLWGVTLDWFICTSWLNWRVIFGK